MTTDSADASPSFDVQAELNELRRGLLPILLLPILPICWAMFFYIILKTGQISYNAIPLALLVLAVGLVLVLRGKHYALACWTLLIAMTVAISLTVWAHPASLAIAYGVLVIVAASALRRGSESLLATTLIWGACAFALKSKLGLAAAFPNMIQSFLLYYLVWGATWLVARLLGTSMDWAFSGWRKANSMLAETRERRGELYRTLRALEEATYRIERMNNELLVARRDAEEARALKARLAATVSHELRAPLNLILGFSKLMALSPESYNEPLPRAYRADVYTVYRNSEHLVALVDDILDLSQIEAQRLPLIKERIDLGKDVIEKALVIVQPLIARKGLVLRREPDDDLPWILADQVRLRQVLLNLLTNAIRFTDTGEITVCAIRRERDILVTVEDTGPGIAAADLPKLFREFSQVRRADKPETASSGLGLSISKHLVELHGGEMWAESQQGVGASFYFTIPLPGTGAETADIVHTEETRNLNATRNCLVVHNDGVSPNAGFLRLLARSLEDYHIVGVPDEREVVALVEELHPTGIVTTPDLAANICDRLAHTDYDVPVVACSLPCEADQERFQGVLGYLIKPVSPEMLAPIMRRVEHTERTGVLLVDDDPDAVRLLERMLTSLPRTYAISKAYDGLQALEVMRDTVPDIVFLDIYMPRLDGEQVITRMRADERLRHVPVVIISARDWAKGNAEIGLPLTLYRRQAVDVAKGARCLQTLFETLSPNYLTDRATPAPSPAGGADQWASGAPASHPEPTPGSVG